MSLLKLEAYDQILKVSSKGAGIYSWQVKDRDGSYFDILDKYENESDYFENPDYLNLIVGPTAGRIKKEDKIILHGGKTGMSKKHWNLEKKENSILCSLIYSTKDNIFGDSLEVRVIYELIDRGLITYYEASIIGDENEADIESSLCNLTSHLYFMLEEKVDDLKLGFKSKRMIYTDDDIYPIGEGVINEEFDFSDIRKIGYTSIDDCFYLDSDIVLESKKIKINISTTYPSAVIYTLNNPQASLRKRGSIAVETQYPPTKGKILDCNNKYKEKTIISYSLK